MEPKELILLSTTTASLYEQLGEEASELAQAALKVARIMRDENPTSTTMSEAILNLREEFTDVSLLADLVVLSKDPYVYKSKIERWVNRINEKNERM